jgi:mono/diheme cytochrome c family protein
MMRYVVLLPRARAVFVGIGSLVAIAASSLLAQAVTPPAPTRPGRSDARPLAGGKGGTGPADAAKAVELYRLHCIECHDADGRGASARETSPGSPDFTDPGRQGARADQELARVIWGGRKSMPAMKGKITRADVDKLVILVHGFRGGRQRISEEHAGAESVSPVPSPDPQQANTRPPDRQPVLGTGNTRSGEVPPGPVPTAFQQFCARCHGISGDGTSKRSIFRSIPDFTSRDWQEKHSESRLRISILEGKGSAMPSFGGKIDEPGATELVAFVRSLAGIAPAERQSSSTGFDDRFQKLMKELESLKREYRTIEPTAASGVDLKDEALTDRSTGRATSREDRMARAAENR